MHLYQIDGGELIHASTRQGLIRVDMYLYQTDGGG